ncbi:MAG TPA: polysaccharide deacetylase family protein [Polyangiaceae bacterium]|nr:polysaccharide deacetylase family protein [Polyangiaceae bacterium]
MRVPVAASVACLAAACVAPGAASWSSSSAQAPATATATAQVPATAPVAKLQCAWPRGAQAAVSLTYDDALSSQLQFAVPALDAAGLKATFFLSGGNIAAFAELAGSGHELASHTLHHPCNADLAALDAASMASELDAGDAAVKELGVTGKLTFAYPCGQLRMKNGESYVPLVQERFRAARGVAASVADPASVDLFNVPALFPPPTSDGTDVLDLVQRAEAQHGWAVIGVHGVTEAGEYLQLQKAAHDKIIAYLAQHRATLWTAPFGSVVDAVLACRAGAQTAGK